MFRWFFFFNDTATTEIYTLSLHDALPIWQREHVGDAAGRARARIPRAEHQPANARVHDRAGAHEDRKSTRLNSSHLVISYAVFCLKKKIATAIPTTSLPHSRTHGATSSA